MTKLARMVKRKKGPFSFEEQRRLRDLASKSVWLEDAARQLGSPAATVQRVAKKIGVKLRPKPSLVAGLAGTVAK